VCVAHGGHHDDITGHRVRDGGAQLRIVGLLGQRQVDHLSLVSGVPDGLGQALR
jgi:hypothetical protein